MMDEDTLAKLEDILADLSPIDRGKWDEWTGDLTLKEDDWGAIRNARDRLKVLLEEKS